MKFAKDITKIKRVTFFETQCRMRAAVGVGHGQRVVFRVRFLRLKSVNIAQMISDRDSCLTNPASPLARLAAWLQGGAV